VSHDTPLRDPRALWALTCLFGDPRVALSLASRFRTWGELRCAPVSEVVRLTQGRTPQLPSACPPLPVLPDGARALGRFDPGYPSRADVAGLPPAVVFVRGLLPPGPMVAIDGGQHPSEPALRVARRAAELTRDLDLTVVAVVSNGCGDAAIDAALARGGRILAIVPFGLGRLQVTNQLLVDRILACGGAVLSPLHPDAHRSQAGVDLCSELAVALSHALVLPEAGLVAGGGLVPAFTALRTGRYLIVTSQPVAKLSGIEAIGSMALSRTDGTSIFGGLPSVADRIAAGRTPADAVVSSDTELLAALRFGCGLTTSRPASIDDAGWVSSS
jgi:DNA processing protein